MTCGAGKDGAGEGAGLRRAAVAHVAPYLVWIAFIVLLQAAGRMALPRVAAPLIYAFKSAICLALLLWLRPWRWYARGGGGGAAVRGMDSLGLALAVGVGVAVLWVLPETPFFFGVARAASLFYHKWLIMPFGAWPEYFDPQAFPALPAAAGGLDYSPAACGWPLAVARLLGSAFVISAAEEYFFRGFLYRWLQGRSWLTAPLSAYDPQAFWGVVAIFAFEHDRWLLGAVAGVAYGFLAVRTGGLRAPIIAHATTNFLLGVYVLASGQYGFW